MPPQVARGSPPWRPPISVFSPDLGNEPRDFSELGECPRLFLKPQRTDWGRMDALSIQRSSTCPRRPVPPCAVASETLSH